MLFLIMRWLVVRLYGLHGVVNAAAIAAVQQWWSSWRSCCCR
jgi:hypothetical protein